MSAHTPGPWTVTEDSGDVGDVSMACQIGIDAPGREDFDTYLATVVGGDPDELKANAYLIAVAPDLLQIAQLLALATNEGDDFAQGTHYIDKQGAIRCKGSFLDLIEKARAAIAKAGVEA